MEKKCYTYPLFDHLGQVTVQLCPFSFISDKIIFVSEQKNLMHFSISCYPEIHKQLYSLRAREGNYSCYERKQHSSLAHAARGFSEPRPALNSASFCSYQVILQLLNRQLTLLKSLTSLTNLLLEFTASFIQGKCDKHLCAILLIIGEEKKNLNIQIILIVKTLNVLDINHNYF